MRHLSAAILILLFAVAPSCKFFKNTKLFGRKARALEALHAQQDSIRRADSLKQVQQRLLDIENAKLDSIRLAEEARQAVENSNKYNIIVGSFITPEYAKEFAESYRQQGFDVKIIKMDNSKFELVSAESHQSIRRAISRLQQFQDTVNIDAWLFTKK